VSSHSPPEGQSRLGLVRGLGMIGAIALVTGNIIGSGIYVIPASLAQVAGPVSLFAWVIVAIAYLSLTAVYSDLVRALPLSGGLQVYAQRAFGDLAGFVTAFLYWLSCVIGNAAFLTAFVGYFQVGIPVFGQPLPAFFLAQALLWSLTLINIAGVRAGGIVQIVTTVIKLLPLVVLAVVLIPSGSSSNLVPFAPHGFMALFPAISLVAWLFLGAESATVPAEEVKGAGVTVGRAAYIGYALAAVVYLVVGFAMTYGMPASAIEKSPSPLADAARLLLGPAGTTFVTLGALVSIAGILNGWILVAGRLPFAAARQGFGPAFLGKVNPRTGTPIPAILLSSAITGALATLYFLPSQTLLEAYNFVALAATATALVAIGAACLAEVVLVFREPALFTPLQRRRGPVTACIGFAAVLLMIYGTGGWVWFWTLCTLVLAVPLFYILRAISGGERSAFAS
jgi:APA family basic amino acid/polyamine antiporter